MNKLGGRCALCGCRDDLQLDVIKSVGPAHHGMSFRDRQRFYLTQYTLNNLRILCGRCNRAEGLKHRTRRALFKRLNQSPAAIGIVVPSAAEPLPALPSQIP